MYGNFFLLCAGLVRLGHAAYAVQSNFDASNWADAFDFQTVKSVNFNVMIQLNTLIGG